MEIKLKLEKNTRELRTLGEFLSAIVVNKGLFYPLHIATHLRHMQNIGIGLWNSSAGELENKPRYQAQKKKRWNVDEFGVISGGTKSQATFSDGSAEMHMTGRGNILFNISPADWKPLRGEHVWKSKYNDRPFWKFDKTVGYWQPGSYVHVDNADKNIWKTMPDGEVTLTEAKKCLIMSTAQTRQLLTRKFIQLGSWRNNRAKGYASRWR